MTDPTTRLLAATRRRLFVITLALVAMLIVLIGAATAFVGLRVLDLDVDRALASTVDAAVTRLDGELPASQASGESDDTSPASADTLLLYLDASGKEIANPSRIALGGLPDPAAVSAAIATGRDLRTVDVGGVEVRLMTEPVVPSPGKPPIGYVQGGFVLTLHDQQSTSLVAAIALVGVVGLFGAAIVTLVVAGDALVPIRRSLAAQRRFVADASHELKTPPAIIRANAEVLEREGLVNEDGRVLVADIVTETDRLSRLVGDLLQIASSDAVGLVIERRPTDLGAVAVDAVRQAEALAAVRQVELRCEPGHEHGASTAVSGDRDRLTQLVVILIDNALDHTPAGTTVGVAVRRADRRVELTVTDQGPGIPPTERDRVFEPFTRLPGVRDHAGGNGLGLAIAQRIAVAHDGTIAVDDARGGGARFVVSLPRTSDGPAAD